MILAAFVSSLTGYILYKEVTELKEEVRELKKINSSITNKIENINLYNSNTIHTMGTDIHTMHKNIEELTLLFGNFQNNEIKYSEENTKLTNIKLD